MSVATVPPYPPQVIDHFTHPRNVGRLDRADDVIEVEAGSTGAGALFQLSAQVRDDAVIAVRFQAYGCPYCIAAASWLSEQLQGAGLKRVQEWSWREAAENLQVPPEKRGLMLILEDAVRRLADCWQRKGS